LGQSAAGPNDFRGHPTTNRHDHPATEIEMTGRIGALLAMGLLAACSGSPTGTPSAATAVPSAGAASPAPTAAATVLPTAAPTETGETPSGRILFGQQTAGWDGWKIMVVNPDGTAEQQFFEDPHDVTRVSHDGTRIASVSFDDKGVFVTIFDADGSNPKELRPDVTLNAGAMAWSRDDEWLAFEGWDDTDHSRDGLWIMRTDGSELRRLTDSGVPGDFSLDDKQIVFTREVGIFVIGVDGKNERQLKSVGSAPYPGYLPDGSVYSASGSAVWIVDVAADTSTPLGTNGGRPIEPRLSPDGKTFVFSMFPRDEDSIGIWTMSVDGSNLRRVLNNPGAEEVFPDWLP
jgi:Tol biopolymer transport system component